MPKPDYTYTPGQVPHLLAELATVRHLTANMAESADEWIESQRDGKFAATVHEVIDKHDRQLRLLADH